MQLEPTAFFGALAHETRLRCLVLLGGHDELCVCELTHAIGVSPPHISRHLAQLREIGLVSDRREGLWVYYRVNPALPQWARSVLAETADAIGRQSPFVDDARALHEMPNRPGALRCG